LVEIWTEGLFSESHYSIESLEQAMRDSDFAIVIAPPNNFMNTRRQAKHIPRDKVIFELGVFVGYLGSRRVLHLELCREEEKSSTNLSGLITISYHDDDLKALSSLLDPACHRMRKIINDLGPRN
jgi:CRP/FNR family cyclic AMP-dependent transcriptional regulator